MNYPKLLLVAAIMTGFIAGGCGGKKRIEGMEIPTQPQSNDVTVPDQAAPPPMAEAPAPEAPPAPETAPTPEPTEPPAPPPPEVKPPKANPCKNYIVIKGDTLWGISGMGLAYRDNFQWPLIFKANRDQITDPDLIYPKQEFCIRQDFTDEDVKKARKDASDTPKYVPHTKPRETLPVNYF
jgi:hypothetical protein